MNKPRFNGTPVASLDSLSAMLGIERKRLDWIVKSVSMSYMPLFILGKEQLYVLISPIFIPALVKKMFVLFLKI